jgi:ABC-2 type transport system permease protein
MNTLLWSVRRELWENRSIYLVPLSVGGVVLFGFFLSLPNLPERLRAAQTTSLTSAHQIVETPYVVGAIILMGAQLVLSILYCLDALYGERRDRSVLFWKSLPVSDLTTVLAKALIPVLVLPLVTWAVTVVTLGAMLTISRVVLQANGLNASIVTAHISFFDIARYNFGHLVAFHGLWYAPLYAWLLLVSAWATRLPFVWAALPPVALLVVERIAFNGRVIHNLLQHLFMGGPEPAGGVTGMTMERMAPSMGDFLFGPGLWVGLAVSGALLFAAVRLRRSRGVV